MKTMSYKELVDKRKGYVVNYDGFINQSEINRGEFDKGDYLDPLAQWHNSIPADILVLGQDWGNAKYYIENQGRDVKSNPTCHNLIELFRNLSPPVEIGDPRTPASNLLLHFANIIPFIRIDLMAGDKSRVTKAKIINDDIIMQCGDMFLRPLINIIMPLNKPLIIITLGLSPLKGLLKLFSENLPNQSHTKTVESIPIHLLSGKIKVFPRFHCGAGIVNRTRKLDTQKMDWRKVKL
jgi:hypothetical protein